MLHLGHGAGQRIGEDAVDRAVTLTESTSPSALLCGSLDAARRQAAVHGRELLAQTMRALALVREQIREIDGINLELYAENVLVAVFGMAERGAPEAARLVEALREAVRRVGLDPGG